MAYVGKRERERKEEKGKREARDGREGSESKDDATREQVTFQCAPKQESSDAWWEREAHLDQLDLRTPLEYLKTSIPMDAKCHVLEKVEGYLRRVNPSLSKMEVPTQK